METERQSESEQKKILIIILLLLFLLYKKRRVSVRERGIYIYIAIQPYLYMLWSHFLVQVWPFEGLLSGPSGFFVNIVCQKHYKIVVSAQFVCI